jgi:hypothetical protein
VGGQIRGQLANLGLQVIDLRLQRLEIRATGQRSDEGDGGNLNSNALHRNPLLAWINPPNIKLPKPCRMQHAAKAIAASQLDHNLYGRRNSNLPCGA